MSIVSISFDTTYIAMIFKKYFIWMFPYCYFYVARPVFFLCISCVKKSRACRRCWLYMHVDDPQHYDAFLCPGEKLYSVTAAHTRWLSKEGQVVVPSAAQSSVDAAHADICLPRSLQGEKKSAFPYACTHCNSCLHPPPLLHSAAPPSFPQSQPDGSLNIVYHGLQSQMQTVSIGIPILPS